MSNINKRKPFKLVNDLDLSGNEIIDVTHIYRRDYTQEGFPLDLKITAGSDKEPAVAPDLPGGTLCLSSGKGGGSSVDGSLHLHIADTEKGILIDGSTKIDILTADEDVLICTGPGHSNTTFVRSQKAVDIPASTTVTNDNISGAFKVGGGVHVGENLVVSGGKIASQAGTFYLLDENVTTAKILRDATSIEIGNNNNTSEVIFRTTKDATAFGNAGVLIKGGLAVEKNLYVRRDSYLGDVAGDKTTIRGSLYLSDNDSTHKITLSSGPGAVNLYKGRDNELEIDDHLKINGVDDTARIESAETVNLFNTTDYLNIAKTGSQTEIKGSVKIKEDFELEGKLPYLLFKEESSSPVTKQKGLLYFSEEDNTLNFIPSTSEEGVELNLGQEEYIRVKNSTGSTIQNGSVVYAKNTTSDGLIEVELADATSFEKSVVLGVATHDIEDGDAGFITTHGFVRDLPPTGLSTGIVYLSTTPGKLTNTGPSEPHNVITIGFLTSNPSESLYVDVHQSWATKAAYNNLRAHHFRAYKDFKLPLIEANNPDQGYLYWNTLDQILRGYDAASGVWREYIDADSPNQHLTNKTYNRLELTEKTTGFEIENIDTITKTLKVKTNTTLDGGDLELTAHNNGSKLILTEGTIEITELTSGYPIYAGAKNKLVTEQYLNTTRGGTGLGSFDVNRIYKGAGTNPLAKSSIFDDGSLVKLDEDISFEVRGNSTIAHNSTYDGYSVNLKNSEAKTNNSGVINIQDTSTSGVSGKTKKVVDVLGSGSFLGNVFGVYVDVKGGTKNYSFYGEAGEFHNEGAGTFKGDLALNASNFTTDKSTMNLFNSKASLNLNVAGGTNSIVNMGGPENTAARTMNVFAKTNFGAQGKPREVNFYGDANYGGPSGFKIVWNNSDDTLDFVKL